MPHSRRTAPDTTERPMLASTARKLSVRFRRGGLTAMLFALVGFSSFSLLFFGSFLSQTERTERSIAHGHSPPYPRPIARAPSLGSVCPELNIPYLIQNNTVNLSDIKMSQSELDIFQQHRDQIERIVMDGNRMLQTTLQGARNNKSSLMEDPITVSLSPLATQVGNYTYLPGGHWKPTTCLPRWKVAIIIPYRNRSYHLPILLRYLTPMLQRQKLEFGFYIVHQANELNFNRAMLMNVGFVESLNFSKWDCFIFHDVDHVPISDLNYYGCSGMPRHFVSGVDKWKYKLLYNSFFGAVSGLTTDNLRRINGFPNVYWGWGGEDDELFSRCKAAGLPVSRPVGPPGYYNVIRHHHVRAKPLKERFNLLRNFQSRAKHDGLSNLQYKRPLLELHQLYTNISVDIRELHVDPRLLKPKRTVSKRVVNKKPVPPKRQVKPATPIKREPRNQTRPAAAGNSTLANGEPRKS